VKRAIRDPGTVAGFGVFCLGLLAIDGVFVALIQWVAR